MRFAARLGELLDPLGDRALLAEDEGANLVGVLTYRVDGRDCEVTTLYTPTSQRGIGSALMEAGVDAARQGASDPTVERPDVPIDEGAGPGWPRSTAPPPFGTP